MGKKRVRRVGSVKKELLKKSREAALAAVQIFNNPNITFKSESYIVLMTIAWTYLLHAYYREQGVEYRYFKKTGQRRVFDKTKKGADKHWELERCLNDDNSPIDIDTSNNLKFLIGLRHEIEHQMTTRIDDLLSARFQACCLNYNSYIKELFEKDDGIDKHLSFSLQLSTIDNEQKDMLSDHPELPKHIQSYVQEFDNLLSEDEYASQRYAYRILFVPKTANRKGQADRVIEFVKSDSPLAKNMNTEYAVIKETDRDKFIPSQIVKIMNNQGFVNFSMHDHTTLWQTKDAKNPAKGYGVNVASKYWHWYQSWVDIVLDHCNQNRQKYT
tara:strand:+ start:22566 stop:23549 length:984 start_codon:yes stop_codon:yes gene_type:complete